MDVYFILYCAVYTIHTVTCSLGMVTFSMSNNLFDNNSKKLRVNYEVDTLTHTLSHTHTHTLTHTHSHSHTLTHTHRH